MASNANAETRLAKFLSAKDKKIQAAMAKAIREVKRDARTRGVKLAVASKNAWAISR